MSLRVTLDISSGLDEELQEIAAGLADAKPLHDRIAGDAEAWLKQDVGPRIAAGQHRTAQTLGASPTGHLVDAYQGIEGVSDSAGATLLIPGATRLRAAFGKYVLTPKNGSKFLTIPVARDAYGHRAREFDDLFPVRTGPRKTLTLSRPRGNGLEVMYVLVSTATIPEDTTLIPFPELEEKALLSAGDFLDDILEGGLS